MFFSLSLSLTLCRTDKIITKPSAIHAVVALENWVLKTSHYNVNIAHQSDTALVAVKVSVDHTIPNMHTHIGDILSSVRFIYCIIFCCCGSFSRSLVPFLIRMTASIVICVYRREENTKRFRFGRVCDLDLERVLAYSPTTVFCLKFHIFGPCMMCICQCHSINLLPH